MIQRQRGAQARNCNGQPHPQHAAQASWQRALAASRRSAARLGRLGQPGHSASLILWNHIMAGRVVGRLCFLALAVAAGAALASAADGTADATGEAHIT